MAYEVLARKYRPQQFSQVVGQEHVTRTLMNAIASGRVAHAYLFVGPRGIGKTSIARIFAKALNCAGGPRVEPCDRCDSCLEIIAGRSMDVLEIDGASNNGVDQVRSLRENAQYLPARDAFKIYIIDEVHMLSIGAFNALLKTLEEPPPRVKFFFATTEPHKVPTTIASRCQRFDLQRIPATEIMRHLAEIARKEGVEIDVDALWAIARGAEGGLRDAESALDQLIAFCGRRIEEQDVLSVFGLAARQVLNELGAAVLKGDFARIVEQVAELERSGKDLSRVLTELIEWFRHALVILCGDDAVRTLDVTEEQLADLRGQVAGADRERVLRILETLMEADGRMRYALSRRVLLETALFQCARAATTVTLNELLRELNRLKAQWANTAVGNTGGTSEAPAIRPVMASEGGVLTPTIPPADPEEKEASLPMRSASSAPSAAPAGSAPEANAMWREAVENIGRLFPDLRTPLMHARLGPVSNGTATILFEKAHPDTLRACEEPMAHKAIRKELQRLLNVADLQVRFELGGETSRRESLPAGIPEPEAQKKTSDPVRPSSSPSSPTPASVRMQEDEVRRRILSDPAVKRVLEKFEGTITDIRL